MIMQSPQSSTESTATPVPQAASPMSSTDEMWKSDQQVHDHWSPVFEHFQSQTPRDIRNLKQSILRLIHENGITYTSPGESGNPVRPWQLDPVPFVLSPTDWAEMETGLLQRAQLLNLVLDDIYGPRNLIREGLLPPELIFSHSEFLRACCGEDGCRKLILSAEDLARGPDGKMWVINDRTQAPSGGGYCLENRDILNRLYPSLIGRCKVRRLASFFRQLKSTLQSLAPNGKEDPRIVILTPGPFAETYFEHAYLAAYLGYTLVQGEDLTVRDNRVWLRSLAGLEPVDVILRRVDSSYCDPLVFRTDSFLGVAGLMNAVREGNVALANPLGSGVLENPALMAFLPRICEFFFNEGLKLPSAATWWCGQPNELQYVLEHADQLVIKSIDRNPNLGSVFGANLSKTELEKLKKRIQARPYHYVGQEAVSFSTMPCLGDEGLEHRHGVLRAMIIATGKDASSAYMAMPGGLTRSAGGMDTFTVSNSAGGDSKDTWVLADEFEPYESLWGSSSDPHELAPDERNLPSRAGENLFWAGRYAERAEGMARILRRSLRCYFGEVLQGTTGDGTQMQILLDALFVVIGIEQEEPKTQKKKKVRPSYEEQLLPILDGAAAPGTFGFTLSSFANSCFAVRDLWSYDSWRVIQSIESHRQRLENPKKRSMNKYLDDLNELITKLMALIGLNLESMTRQAGWLMLDTGRRLERSQWLINIIQSILTSPIGESQLTVKLENLLAATGSLVTHQRRYRSQPQVESVLELMLLDENYPRSLIYQINRVQNHATLFPGKPGFGILREYDKLLLQAHTILKLCDISKLVLKDPKSSERENLNELLTQLSQMISGVSEYVTLYYFSHVSPNHLLS